VRYFEVGIAWIAAEKKLAAELAWSALPRGPGDSRAGPKQITAQGKKLGRKDAMPSGTQRARYQKLAAAKPKLKSIARKLRRSR
jgi:hypothetical protein